MYRAVLIVVLLGLGGCASTYHERYRYYADGSHGGYYYEPAPRPAGWVGIHAGYGAAYYDPFWSLGFHYGTPAWYPRYYWGHFGWYGSPWGYWGWHRPWWGHPVHYGYWDRHYAWNRHWRHHHHPRDRDRGPRRGLRGRMHDTVAGPGPQRSARSMAEASAREQRRGGGSGVLAPERRSPSPAVRTPIPRSEGGARPQPVRPTDQRWQRPDLRSSSDRPVTVPLPSREYSSRSGRAPFDAAIAPAGERFVPRRPVAERNAGIDTSTRARARAPTTPTAVPLAPPANRSESFVPRAAPRPAVSPRPSSRPAAAEPRPMRSGSRSRSER